MEDVEDMTLWTEPLRSLCTRWRVDCAVAYKFPCVRVLWNVLVRNGSPANDNGKGFWVYKYCGIGTRESSTSTIYDRDGRRSRGRWEREGQSGGDRRRRRRRCPCQIHAVRRRRGSYRSVRILFAEYFTSSLFRSSSQCDACGLPLISNLISFSYVVVSAFILVILELVSYPCPSIVLVVFLIIWESKVTRCCNRWTKASAWLVFSFYGMDSKSKCICEV